MASMLAIIIPALPFLMALWLGTAAVKQEFAMAEVDQ